MKKRYAIVTASVLFSATRSIHADVTDSFTRSDGSISADSIGLTESGPDKYAYSERFSPNGPDDTGVASIVNNALLISGTGIGSTTLTAASSPGIVYLDGYNNAFPTMTATVSFDQGVYNDTTQIGATSLTANTAGFILRAPPNMNFNTPNVASMEGLIGAEIGPNGDILMREVGPANTLLTLYSKNPFTNASSTRKPVPGKLPAQINGIPFDVNQDGMLEPNEPFTLSVQVINLGGVSGISMFVDGEDVADASLTFNGSASGINGVAMYKNRTAAANNIVSNVTFDNLDISPSGAGATTSSWAVDSDGSWTNASNWSNGSPFAVDSVANFGSLTTAARTVTLDASQVIGTINFDNLNGYTLTALTQGTISTNLILAASTGAVAINVLSGNQTIAAGVEVKADTGINVAASSSLAITGTLLGTGRTVTQSGGGPVQYGALKVGAFILNAGAATITAKSAPNTAAGTSVVGSLSFGSGLSLDLTNNDLIYDYSNGGIADPAQTTFMRNLIKSAYDGGAWDGAGLTSSTAAAIATSGGPFKTGLAYGEASSANIGTFDGIAVDHDAIVVKYTVMGDANLDRLTTVADFNILAMNFNKSGSWLQGDFNYDGIVNASDFAILAANYGNSLTAPALGTLVPEPISIGSIGALFAMTSLRRRRSY